MSQEQPAHDAENVEFVEQMLSMMIDAGLLLDRDGDLHMLLLHVFKQFGRGLRAVHVEQGRKPPAPLESLPPE